MAFIGYDIGMTKIAVILNPTSGRGRGESQRETIHRLMDSAATASPHPVEWEIFRTYARGDATHLAKHASDEGADIVVAAGGDGTCGEVVNGIAGGQAAFGVIPVGTGNDFARTIGVFGELETAIDILFSDHSRMVDLGKIGDRWFLNVAGCGFDAKVAERVNRGYRHLNDSMAYIAGVLQTLISFKSPHFKLTMDGSTYESDGMLCTIANAPSYGGGMRVAPQAEIDDGVLDICFLKHAGRIEFLRAFPKVFKGEHVTHPKVRMFHAKRGRVETIPPMPILVDGEVIGETPVDFEIKPHIIKVMSPFDKKSKRGKEFEILR